MQPIVIPANHSCLQGHFEAQAIVPGAYLLSLGLSYVRKHHQHDFPSPWIVQAKFLKPLLPNKPFNWQLTIQSDGKYGVLTAIQAQSQQILLKARVISR